MWKQQSNVNVKAVVLDYQSLVIAFSIYQIVKVAEAPSHE